MLLTNIRVFVGIIFSDIVLVGRYGGITNQNEDDQYICIGKLHIHIDETRDGKTTRI